jgi:hypothetical protein
LTQPEVREQKEPESEFLRYLDGHREEETIGDREVEGMGDDVPISITLEAFGQVIGLPKDVRLLTIGQTRYLKEHHLKGLDGYEGIEWFTTLFSEASALEGREYGNVFYDSMGTDPWQKVYKVTVERVQVEKNQ